MSRLLLLAFPAMTVALLFLPGPAGAQNLRGSSASLDRQNAQAAAHDFTYLRDRAQLQRFVNAGYLVPVRPNGDFDLYAVSFPYARPEVRLFIERLASQHRAACGEKLVVTSLTRPLSHQPPNASDRSVHPTGMALDLRRSANARCRNWLERTLLSLTAAGTLEAIYEQNPPHYHVAVYPQPYAAYVARITNAPAADIQIASLPSAAEASAPAPAPEGPTIHTVARGESLWTIARAYGVPEGRIQAENGLRGSRILAGQQLRIPSSGDLPASTASIQHRVAPGESLWSISQQYGASIDEIQTVNGMNMTRIFANQLIEIPVSQEP